MFPVIFGPFWCHFRPSGTPFWAPDPPFLVHFGPKMAQKRAKMGPKWTKNDPKMVQSGYLWAPNVSKYISKPLPACFDTIWATRDPSRSEKWVKKLVFCSYLFKY